MPHVRAYTSHGIRALFAGQPVRLVHHGIIYPGFDNITARHATLGPLLRRALYTAEHTPLAGVRPVALPGGAQGPPRSCRSPRRRISGRVSAATDHRARERVPAPPGAAWHPMPRQSLAWSRTAIGPHRSALIAAPSRAEGSWPGLVAWPRSAAPGLPRSRGPRVGFQLTTSPSTMARTRQPPSSTRRAELSSSRTTSSRRRASPPRWAPAPR